MDFQSHCYAYNENMMLVSSIDPFVNDTFSQFHESVTEMEQQFNTMNNSFATVSDEMLLENPDFEDSVITKNQSPQGTSSAAQDNFQFAPEERMSDWSVDSLPMFPDMQMFPNLVSMDENYQQIPMVDELRQESELTEFPTNYEQLQQVSESTNLPMIDEQLQPEPKLTQVPRKPTKKRPIQNSTHKYNTRGNAYKKSIEEFLKAQSKITEELRKKSCPPIFFKTHAEGKWIYPEDRTQIVLLRCDIQPIKHPNYVQKRKYRKKT